MRSFFLGDNELAGDLVTVTGELYRHMARVLRLKPGSEVVLTDRDGARLLGSVEEVGAKSLTVRVATREEGGGVESPLSVTLYQGMPKGEKLDLILQKCTELGMAGLVAFEAARSVVKLREGKEGGRLERCRRIVQEAARQSGRSRAPELALAGSLKQALRQADQELKLLLWEDEEKRHLRPLLEGQPAPASVAVLVGPEGGLTSEEVALAMESGFIPVSLGRRILRTETAGLAVLSILQFHWGDLG